MPKQPDFENRNRVSILQRLGMQESEKFQVSGNPIAVADASEDDAPDGTCPDHPLGQDLFYVLWNANRT
ncbi:MAG: hypothetical protein JJ959_04470 [Nisaea sp.]|uniref:hypothetical protein n=1 Tax=Nisaea sp. TaxID=2024842 RepID=UPI001B110A8A|nr:hypothetical protein [Nisaea sp.]MBO6559764.1 hypothetical protein [Nisaea sp.]